jgi:hypothetical protein
MLAGLLSSTFRTTDKARIKALLEAFASPRKDCQCSLICLCVDSITTEAQLNQYEFCIRDSTCAHREFKLKLPEEEAILICVRHTGRHTGNFVFWVVVTQWYFQNSHSLYRRPQWITMNYDTIFVVRGRENGEIYGKLQFGLMISSIVNWIVQFGLFITVRARKKCS